MSWTIYEEKLFSMRVLTFRCFHLFKLKLLNLFKKKNSILELEKENTVLKCEKSNKIFEFELLKREYTSYKDLIEDRVKEGFAFIEIKYLNDNPIYTFHNVNKERIEAYVIGTKSHLAYEINYTSHPHLKITTLDYIGIGKEIDENKGYGSFGLYNFIRLVKKTSSKAIEGELTTITMQPRKECYRSEKEIENKLISFYRKNNFTVSKSKNKESSVFAKIELLFK